MISFLTASDNLDGALTGVYDPPLIAVSYAVACVASYAALLIGGRIAAAEDRRTAILWLGTGAVTLGNGVWAMHFLGMLAFVLPIPVAYDLSTTLASGVPAILAGAVALHVMSRPRAHHLHYITAGVLLGAGVGAMHFSGMAAMRMHADMRYDPALFGLSIVVAVVLGILAIYVHDLGRLMTRSRAAGLARPLAAALVGLAITGMHYTAMGATYFLPAPGHPIDHVALDPFWLSTAVAVVTVMIAAAAIGATLFDRRLQEVAQAARVTRQRMVEAIESISDGFILFDAGGGLVMCNSVFRAMYPALHAILEPGTHYRDVIRAWALQRHPSEEAEVEEYVARCLERFEGGQSLGDEQEEERLHDGRWMYVRQKSVGSGGIVGVWTDVTPIKQLQAHFENKALHDPLTGLPNRQLFDDRLEHAAERTHRSGGSVALLYVDLDKFKPINDTLGHDAGDAVLKEVGVRLRGAVRASDTVARLGGDEFAVILEPEGTREVAERAAARILASLARPISLGGEPRTIGASIGIGLSSAADFSKETIVKNADQAMYEAKRETGNTFRTHGG
ncbi:MAG: diguanylate cyclase [Hyphomicrobiales bacterium]|nr:diguanylate cyclase [Hyphomicrobiales bacterium]MCP5372805.1 diguanylate cyclase [Hyphomicrobiales bacterium]